MTWVKICGITNLEDALVAVDAGADALGFVFHEKSPRKIVPEETREIISNLPDNVDKVGVFVDSDPEDIRNVVSETGLTVVQLHGKKSMEQVWKNPGPVAKCVGVSKIIPVIPGDSLKGDVLISQRAQRGIFAVLLDSRSNGASGGTGTTFDWETTQGVVQSLGMLVPVIVAGGLTALNVTRALNLLQPFGVDVASGVEARPGKKDPGKVRVFIDAVRKADKKTQ
jgi:phosphoribosylanthranilate isomerase